MAKSGTLQSNASAFEHITDPVLRKKLEEVASQHQVTKRDIPPEVNTYPKFVFSRTTPSRAIGGPVRVRNGLDEEPRGGTILERIGRAYRVDVNGEVLIVHEADDSWG